MTLDELKFIRIQLIRTNRQKDEINEALVIINREITLKTMDPRKTFGDVGTNDPNGNLITGP